MGDLGRVMMLEATLFAISAVPEEVNAEALETRGAAEGTGFAAPPLVCIGRLRSLPYFHKCQFRLLGHSKRCGDFRWGCFPCSGQRIRGGYRGGFLC